MTKEELGKEAEEIANKKLCATTMCYNHCNFNSPKHHRCGEWHRCYEIAKDGAEFGYNKANEWHYVKDGDLPKEEGDFLFYLYDKETKDTFCEVLGIARTYSDRDDMYIESMLWTLDDVIAWKEIVLPELKENE